MVIVDQIVRVFLNFKLLFKFVFLKLKLSWLDCVSSQNLTPVPNSCTNYYTCVNGVLSINVCPTGQVFDSVILEKYL